MIAVLFPQILAIITRRTIGTQRYTIYGRVRVKFSVRNSLKIIFPEIYFRGIFLCKYTHTHIYILNGREKISPVCYDPRIHGGIIKIVKFGTKTELPSMVDRFVAKCGRKLNRLFENRSKETPRRTRLLGHKSTND